jgi:hypothetical protein
MWCQVAAEEDRLIEAERMRAEEEQRLQQVSKKSILFNFGK